MIYKGIVEAVSGAQATVRIPTLDKSASAVGATQAGQLSDACICTFPGISVQLQVNDIVFVEFEDTINQAPVIIGTLFGYNTTSRCNISSNELHTAVRCTLPKDTQIGDITYSQLEKLINTENNLQDIIRALKDDITKLKQQVNHLIGENSTLKYQIENLNNK